MRRGIDYHGISVLCYCLDAHTGQWVVHKRAKRCKINGVWGFLTGKLEIRQGKTEQPRTCAMREIEEEYGVKVTYMQPLEPHVSESFDPDRNKHQWLMLPYFVVVDAGLIKADEDEVEEWDMVESIEDIPRPRHPGLEDELVLHRDELERLRDMVLERKRRVLTGTVTS